MAKTTATERDEAYASALWRLTMAKEYAVEAEDAELAETISAAISRCDSEREALAPEIRREAQAEREERERNYRRITR